MPDFLLRLPGGEDRAHYEGGGQNGAATGEGEMGEQMRERLEESLAGVVGQPLWSAVTGPQGNYVLSLELGEQQRRRVRLANPRLSFLKRTYEGTYSFLIECPWRVDAEDRVLSSAFEAFDREAPPVREVGELTDRVVERVEVERPGGDLRLVLSGGVLLRCFALEVRQRPERRNWTYWSPSGGLSMGPKGRVTERQEAEAEATLAWHLGGAEGPEPDPRTPRRMPLLDEDGDDEPAPVVDEDEP